ncbi:MAG: S49 family peptidase [Spirochaetaceae bacterium]|nr:MAG: S49 family peptidase [Spirochaetaceae bacterium]
MTRWCGAALVFLASLLAFVTVNPLSGQDLAASAATAEGYEGLQYNPAALAAGRSLGAGFGTIFADSDTFSLSATLTDSLRLDYQRDGAEEELSLACGLAFPRESAFHLGVSAAADLFDFQWSQVDLGTGLLWYPHRYLAFAATQEHLLDTPSRRYVFGIGLRPLTDRLTLFGDVIFPHNFSSMDTALGIRVEPLDGQRVGFRMENGFQDFVAVMSLTANALSLDLSAAGDLDFNEVRFGAGLRYDLLPSPSVLEFSPKVYHIPFSKPIDPTSGQRDSLYNLDSLVTSLYRLAEQPRLETLVLSFEATTVLSIDVLEELVEVFAYLKSRGKRIVTYLDSSYSEFDYLTAAAGTTVVASPYTLIPLVGVGTRQLYFKRLFEELGIEVEYARSSDYKSALDRFLRENLSEENRRQLEEYLLSSYELILDILVSSRGLSRERAVELVDGGPYWCEEAAELGLVDEVAYYQEFEETYLEEGTVARLGYREYRPRNWRSPQIAVVKASGPIISSQVLGPWDRLSSRSYITDKNLIPVLKHLQEDALTRAVVLYIDSGGGDGMVSDKIWKAIVELKEEKPVVVVMGRLAASGGYYLAMAGERVFARRTALTGSIGSYTYKLVIAELLERLGVTTDSIQFGKNVELYSPFAQLNEEQRQKLRDLNDSFTAHFYRRVAESRALPYETVEELGAGRIYSGERALELDLIDELGGVYLAIKYLEEELDLSEEEYRLRYYPDWSMLLRMALEELEGSNLSAPRAYRLLSRFLFR